MDCPRCGTKNPDEMKFCGMCGEKLSSLENGASNLGDSSRSRICVECGRDIAWYANLCPYCGHRYGSEMRTTAQPTWKPVTGGALSVIVASLALLSVFGLSLGYGYGFPYYYYYYGYGSNIFLVLGLPIVAIAGGSCAIFRKFFAFSLIGCICSIVLSVIFNSSIFVVVGLAATILVGASYGEFKK